MLSARLKEALKRYFLTRGIKVVGFISILAVGAVVPFKWESEEKQTSLS